MTLSSLPLLINELIMFVIIVEGISVYFGSFLHCLILVVPFRNFYHTNFCHNLFIL